MTKNLAPTTRRDALTTISLTGAIAAAPLALAQAPAHKACRSVHLAFPGQDVSAFMQTVRVEETVDHTYFMVAGWSTGYFGVQQLDRGKKVVLFSVWDPTAGDDPSKVDPKLRVRQLFKAPEVRVGRFGGEGTGGQSFYDFDWKPNTDVTLAVSFRRVDDRSAYTGWFWRPAAKEWKKLIEFSTVGDHKGLSGLYSFVEDFRRDGVSYGQRRRASFGPGFTWTGDERAAIAQATFTADGSEPTNIEAGKTDDGRFFLATGGETRDGSAGLNKPIEIEPPEATAAAKMWGR